MSKTLLITSNGGKKVNAQFDGFTVETDQTVKNGGEGAAPEPFMLFLASIGTCAGIYVYIFCQKRGIPTDNIRIKQTHERRENGPGLAKITLTIELPADFPDQYRNAVINAANLCAVKKQIQNAPDFEVVTAVEG